MCAARNNNIRLRKILLAVAGSILGVVCLLLVAVGCVLYVEPVRQAVLNKALPIVSEKTSMDIDVGSLYLSPLHHSPMLIYHAYKGKTDLPVTVEIDSLFVGHREQDTLVYTRTLRLNATLKTGNGNGLSDLVSLPIEIEQLYLEQTTFHSDSLIESVGIDAIIGLLDAHSPELNIAQGQYPLYGLRLHDTYVGIDLRDTLPDSTEQDTTPLLMAFDIPDGELKNIHFALTPTELDIYADTLSVNVLADVGNNHYNARRLDAGGMDLTIGTFRLPIDTLYGNAFVDLEKNIINTTVLYAQSNEMGAKADIQTTALNLETMRVDIVGNAEYRGSKARLYASYGIDDETYDATVHIERVNLAPFFSDAPPIVLAGDLTAIGQGFDPKQTLSSRVKLYLNEAHYGQYDLSNTIIEASTDEVTSLAINTNGLNADIYSPLPLFTLIDKCQPLIKSISDTAHINDLASLHDLTVAETIAKQIPAIQADIVLRKNSPIQPLIDSTGIDIDSVTLKMNRDTLRLKTTINKARLGQFNLTHTSIEASTDSLTSIALNTRGLHADFHSPMSLFSLISKTQPLLEALQDTAKIYSLTALQDITILDTIRQSMPAMKVSVKLTKNSPFHPLIYKAGLDIDHATLALNSDSHSTDLALDASINDSQRLETLVTTHNDSTALRLPATRAAISVKMTDGWTTAILNADSHLTDGAMNIHDICTDAALQLNLTREENKLTGEGQLTLDSILYGDTDLGNRVANMTITTSENYANAMRVDVHTDDISLDIISGFVELKDIALHGAVKAHATIDGLPQLTDISAEVLPLQVSAKYEPYDIGLCMGNTPIVMEHNHMNLNALNIYGADSTFVQLDGGLDLNSMQIDISIKADSFAPAKLPQGGPAPIYGELATNIRGAVTGRLDSIVADVDVQVLQLTDITYQIDKKNLAQVKPYGKVNVRYATADADPLKLGGRINIDEGMVRYSPKLYPVMPFKVDSGSHVTFHGPIGQTMIAASASQKVRATVQSEGESSRQVDFITGVRVNGILDSIGMNSIDFFLEAPHDEVITRELASVDENIREGLAATLLATGMYVGNSNYAAQTDDGYALSSIINSRINAFMANSKLGRLFEFDLSRGKTQRAIGETNDFNIAVSTSFLQDRLRLSVGAALSDNPEAYKNVGFLNNISAEYKLTENGNFRLRAFGQRDYNNILEGDLIKSGLGLRWAKEWNLQQYFRGDSLTRTYGLMSDADIAWRSNNSLGPNLTLTHSIRNLLGRSETFTLKGNGAYYWALRNRHPGDPKKTDTYKLGVNAAIVFPYLHWAGNNNPDGDTRYMLGYQYENIAGGYGVHKMSASLTYFIRSSQYLTHAFTPLSLSVVRMKAESDSLLNKAAEYPQLLKILASDEFIPSIGYNFIYNDYNAQRIVNTMFSLGIKESANLIGLLFCPFGYKWTDEHKLGNITINQFIKLTFELRNKFNITDDVCFATRLFAGANIPTNAAGTPLSEAFYAGGANSMRSAAPYAYGPGNFYSERYNQNFFHAGDIKFEANAELRFPIYWKLYGAVFADAGNVWNWVSAGNMYIEEGLTNYKEILQLREDLYDGVFDNPYFWKQVALGTGTGLRLDFNGLVIRLDLGIAIHTPYLTYKYGKDGTPNTSQPINTYFNIPSAWNALRLNFGIGYPF